MEAALCLPLTCDRSQISRCSRPSRSIEQTGCGACRQREQTCRLAVASPALPRVTESIRASRSCPSSLCLLKLTWTALVLIFRNNGDGGLGQQENAGNRYRILKRYPHHLRRIDDAGLHQVHIVAS